MQRLQTFMLGCALAFAVTGGAITAKPLAFTGTLSRSNPGAAPGGRCAPALTVYNNNVGTNVATGTSNFGNFLEDASQCLPVLPPTIAYDGQWRFDFTKGSLFGPYSAIVGLTGTPGVFSILGTFTIAGGTGFFGGATGTITENGTLDRRGLPAVALAEGTLTGLINVPEPATVALMAAGMGGLALAKRRQRSRAA